MLVAPSACSPPAAPAHATAARHMGQVRSWSSHSPTQASQNTCRQAISFTGADRASRQMAQASPAAETCARHSLSTPLHSRHSRQCATVGEEADLGCAGGLVRRL
jgi:hypothetical protein